MTDRVTGQCINCGRDSTGLRCKRCHGAYLRELSLEETAERDRELLEMADGEKLSGDRLATRLGISKQRAYVKVREARRREAARNGVYTVPPKG